MTDETLKLQTPQELFDEIVTSTRSQLSARSGPAWLKFRKLFIQKPQREFAEMLGVAQGTISQWETGKQFVEMNSLVRFAKKLTERLGQEIRVKDPNELPYIFPANFQSLSAMQSLMNIAEGMGPDDVIEIASDKKGQPKMTSRLANAMNVKQIAFIMDMSENLSVGILTVSKNNINIRTKPVEPPQ
jgi:transcriptional regulator with XRE-family HTH domain